MEINKLNLNFLRNLNFWIVLIIILSFTMAYYIPSSNRITPVGPLIGGDTWAHLGAVKRMSLDWQPWTDQYYGEGIARSYSWFWHIIIAILSIIFPLYSVAIWFPLFAWIVMIVLSYFMMKELFGRIMALIFVIITYLITLDPHIVNPNPKNFMLLSFFASIYLLYKVFESPGYKWSIICGLSFGMIFWNYTMLGYFFFFPFGYLILNLILREYKDRKEILYLDIKKVLIVCISGAFISILYWLPIVLDYSHENAVLAKELIVASGTNAYYMAYGYPLKMTLSSIFYNGFTINEKWYFIPFALLGYFYVFQNLKKTTSKILLVTILLSILGSFHDLITKPLLGWNGFQPFYFPDFLRYFTYILIILGIVSTLNYFLKFLKNNSQIALTTMLIILTLTTSIIGFIETKNYLTKDYAPWAEQSFNPHPPYFTEPAKWIEANTGLEDVLVAHPYYAYGIFGLTGRRIYAAMYGHFLSQWEDDNQRRKDVREIYETNNLTKALKLLKKHNSTYLIIDPYILDKSQWFEDDNWYYIFNKIPYDYKDRNLTKFLNNSHFQQVYQYQMPQEGKIIPAVTIFKIKY